jgi:hypothetical protein
MLVLCLCCACAVLGWRRGTSQVREDNRKRTELDELIRTAQQKVAASRRKLDDVERMSATSELTLTVALRGDLERASASMASVRETGNSVWSVFGCKGGAHVCGAGAVR